MSDKFKLDDYVDVAQRITEFYERYPEGSLRTGTQPHVIEIGGRSFIVYHALAYRTSDDTCPSDGWAWEPVPGPTQFTKDSELMNAETAAWGRAIVAAGFKTKKIASANEVRARNGNAAAPPAPFEEPAPEGVPTATEPQRRKMFAVASEKGVGPDTLKALIREHTGQESSAFIPRHKFEAILKALEAA